MKYFKIKTGYSDDDMISIDETELEMALYCFMVDSKGVFKNGVVRGKDIMAITEDYHKAMGWNRGYRFTSEDWGQIDKECSDYKGLLNLAKQNVQELIRINRKELIGKQGTIANRLQLKEITQ